MNKKKKKNIREKKLHVITCNNINSNFDQNIGVVVTCSYM